MGILFVVSSCWLAYLLSDVLQLQERLNNGADATKLQAYALPTLPSSKDVTKSLNSAPGSESGGILSSDAEDTKGYEQSQSLSKSPRSRKEKERRRRDERHSSSSKDYHSKNHSRTSPHPRHHSEAHPRDHSRSREKVMALMVLVQVLGMVLIMTAMIGMGSLADILILLADRRMKGKRAESILFMIDLATGMVAGKGIGMLG